MTVTTSPLPISVMLVDDHPVMRIGLASVLSLNHGFKIVAQADDGIAAIELWRRHKPDVCLLDMRMEGMDGIATLRKLRLEFPKARIVMLTSSKSAEDLAVAMQAGASGYLLKSSLRGELIDALRRVAQGKRCLSAEISEEIAQHLGEEALTSRELSILSALAQGWENKRIANSLGISAETVKSHVARILEKIGAHNRTEAIHIALRRGLVRLDE